MTSSNYANWQHTIEVLPKEKSWQNIRKSIKTISQNHPHTSTTKETLLVCFKKKIKKKIFYFLTIEQTGQVQFSNIFRVFINVTYVKMS